MSETIGNYTAAVKILRYVVIIVRFLVITGPGPTHTVVVHYFLWRTRKLKTPAPGN